LESGDKEKIVIQNHLGALMAKYSIPEVAERIDSTEKLESGQDIGQVPEI
jgi:hypothetical protein